MLRPVVALPLALLAIVASARLLGAVARRLGQPPVIGEILGGILLGPTLFHGAITATLFPAAIRPPLSALANLGVCVFMFFIGLHLDLGRLRGQGRIVGTVSLAAIVVPFGLGALLALYLSGTHPTGNRLAFVLFLGTAMSVTAFPVLARILADQGLIDTPIGGLALACAAVDDVLAWSLLAVVAALAHGGSGSPHAGDSWRLVLAAPYLVLMLGLVRPLLARLAARRTASPWASGVRVLVAAATVALSAWATSWMGLHAIFGAFLAGVVMPHAPAGALGTRVLPRIERVCATMLLPVFFMVAGLKVDLSLLDGAKLLELGLVLLVAIGGKFGGTFAGARLAGVRWRHSTVLGILINTRGLTELIVLTVGLQLAVLDQGLYSMMVVMALITTAMAGVLLRFVYPRARARQDSLRRHDLRPRPLREEPAS